MLQFEHGYPLQVDKADSNFTGFTLIDSPTVLQISKEGSDDDSLFFAESTFAFTIPTNVSQQFTTIAQSKKSVSTGISITHF